MKPKGRLDAQHILNRRSPSQSPTSIPTDQIHFQLELPQLFALPPLSSFQSCAERQSVKCSPALKEKVTLAFSDVRVHPGMEMSSARDEFLLNVVSNV